MPNWNQILDEIKKTASVHDATRRRYLLKLHKLTDRNIILYYSGWLQSPDAPPALVAIGDNDLTGFMSACHKIDKTKGLNLASIGGPLGGGLQGYFPSREVLGKFGG